MAHVVDGSAIANRLLTRWQPRGVGSPTELADSRREVPRDFAAQPLATKSGLQSRLKIALMISGSVRGAAKPIKIVASKAHPTVGSAPADLMMSSAVISSPLTYRTNTRLQPFLLLSDPYLTEEYPYPIVRGPSRS